ncbi:hypothetical protein RN001_012726 [Aquatica leii]|uniref:RING-type domain-containing protein n=1 Tax=Aquatica leii TaxID=1421715 RepID=A0AAN7PT63_9COLE|nr:hypothetical protein RN001_012726 [Aquatica leii]
MADWIHCNKCFIRYRPGVKFFVTTCGHLTCEGCTSKSDGNKCYVCISPCQYIILNNDLKPEMQLFFRSQSDIMEKFQQVFTFQEVNKSALLKNVTDKYLIVKSELMRCCKALQDSKKENAKLKAVLKNLTGQNFTPMLNGSSHPFSSPSQTMTSNNYLNAVSSRRGTPFIYPPNQRSNISWNSKNTPHMTAHQQSIKICT